MWRWIMMVGVASIVGDTPLQADPKPAFPLTASIAPSFAGFLGETAVLELVLHNPSPHEVTFAWTRLDAFVAFEVRDRHGARVRCKPAAAARRTRGPAWFAHAHRDLVVSIDLVPRCKFPGEGDYVIEARFRAPVGTAGARRGSTNTVSTTLVLGGGGGRGAPTTTGVPALCAREATGRSGCFWTRGLFVRCSGVPERAVPTPRYPSAADVPEWSCVCNGCIRDADCTAKANGTCKAFRGDTCQPASHACVYPGDLCHSPERCRGAECLGDGRGGVSCKAPEPPPP